MRTRSITQSNQIPDYENDGLIKSQSVLAGLLRSRNFVLLWIGEAISLLGDQFYLIALPWLTLQLTNDPFSMGMVMAIEGIPRALFMLVGGALTDRFTPLSVMLVSNFMRMILVAGLALMVLFGSIQLWMIFIFALLFGLMDAFFFPAQSSIVPQLVKSDRLPTANAIVMMTQQFSLFGGPVFAGAVIAFFSQRAVAGASDLTGLGIAFAIDALTFLISILSLWFIALPPQSLIDRQASHNVLVAMMDGLRYVQNWPTLRAVFTLIVFANVLIVAPMAVGIPVLVDTRLSQGAAAFGIILSAFGGGNLVGMVLGGMLPRPSNQRLGPILISVWSTMGIGIALLGLSSTTVMAASIGVVMGVANGYVVVVFITWVQTNTPAHMMGRMMSLFGFSTVGLAPIANAMMGAVVSLNLGVAFAGSGLLMTTLVLVAMAFNQPLRDMQAAPAVAAGVI